MRPADRLTLTLTGPTLEALDLLPLPESFKKKQRATIFGETKSLAASPDPETAVVAAKILMRQADTLREQIDGANRIVEMAPRLVGLTSKTLLKSEDYNNRHYGGSGINETHGKDRAKEYLEAVQEFAIRGMDGEAAGFDWNDAKTLHDRASGALARLDNPGPRRIRKPPGPKS